jgi:phosphate transport system substrate-binding protein
MHRKLTVTAVGLSCIALLLAGCGKGGNGAGGATAAPRKTVIAACGSDTMVNLAQMWAEEYHEVCPDVSVEVSGGGSGVGIRDLATGIIDLANSSRDISASERAQAKQNTGKEPKEWRVAYDGIAVYVHKDNPIESLTTEQLAGIYGEGGTIDKWSQLGVKLPNDDIIRISRQNNSGTYVYFREHVLAKKDFKLGSRDMSGSKDVVELVARTPGGIGYSGMGYKIADVKFVKIAASAGAAAAEPTAANVHDESYSLARPLFMYTLGEPPAHVKSYLDWILSPAGQKIVEQAGYVPVVALP